MARTGLTYLWAGERAKAMRRRGWDLKRFRPGTRKGVARKRYDAAAFRALWNASRSLPRVAAALGITPVAVKARLRALRRRGVALDPATRSPVAVTAAEGFERHVRRRPGCWAWTGRVDHYGNARVWFGHDLTVSARKVSWELRTGSPVPAGVVVAATCGNGACTNPDHLVLANHSAASRKVNARLRPLGIVAGPERRHPLRCSYCGAPFLGEIRQKRRQDRGRPVQCSMGCRARKGAA